MLIQQSQFVPSDIERMIKDIQKEDGRFDRELRSAHREKIVLPVTVKFMNGLESIHCISRNISCTGICLLSERELKSDSQCMLEIKRLNDSQSDVMAVCKWHREFGKTHWISGWQFVRMSRRK